MTSLYREICIRFLEYPDFPISKYSEYGIGFKIPKKFGSRYATFGFEISSLYLNQGTILGSEGWCLLCLSFIFPTFCISAKTLIRHDFSYVSQILVLNTSMERTFRIDIYRLQICGNPTYIEEDRTHELANTQKPSMYISMKS